MFGLFVNKEQKKAADRIAEKIYNQIYTALEENGEEAGERVKSTFIVGYLFGFIKLGFTYHGYTGDKYVDKYLIDICDTDLPILYGRDNIKLYRVFKSHLELLQELGIKNHSINNKNYNITLYEMGMESGAYDAGVFSSLNPVNGDNLYKYLTKKKLSYDPLPE